MKQCFWICHHDWHKEEAFKGIFLWFATMLDTHPKPYLNLFHKSKTRAGSEGKGICHKAWQGEFDPRIHIVEGENWFTPKLSSVLHTHTQIHTLMPKMIQDSIYSILRNILFWTKTTLWFYHITNSSCSPHTQVRKLGHILLIFLEAKVKDKKTRSPSWHKLQHHKFQ